MVNRFCYNLVCSGREFHIWPVSQRVHEGDSVTIFCNLHGTISWTRTAGKDLPFDRFDITWESMILHDVKLSDHGPFYCKGYLDGQVIGIKSLLYVSSMF